MDSNHGTNFIFDNWDTVELAKHLVHLCMLYLKTKSGKNVKI